MNKELKEKLTDKLFYVKNDWEADWNELKGIEEYTKYCLILELLLGLKEKPSFDEYRELIDELKKDDEGSKATNLINSTLVDNSAEVNNRHNSNWYLYKNEELKKNKNWSQKSIRTLELSSESVLKRLSLDMDITNGAVKGLVVGNVQSGKTANMTGLMAMAADNGFNVFIVLSGMIESLREQNGDRIYSDLSRRGSDYAWKLFNNDAIDDLPATKNRDLRKNSHDRHLVVVLKNKSRLEKLKKWLNYDKNQKKKMKILLIDDEADQASINTRDINSEDEQATAINQLIKDIVNDHEFGAMNYVAYTATPFANVLNEVGEETLYPKDFISILTAADEYVGPDQVFGRNDPDYQDRLDIVRSISAESTSTVRSIQTKKSDEDIPGDFKHAINWFLIASAAMRAKGYQKPISMMIHTDFKVDAHQIIDSKVQSYLKELKKDPNSSLVKLKEQYITETNKLTISDFMKVLPNYSREIEDYPAWNLVEAKLKELFGLQSGEYVTRINSQGDGKYSYGNGLHVCVDNSQSRDDDAHQIRLRYPEKNDSVKEAPLFIVIGGNTLSRGLTIQGLVSTFFLRNTNQADTLMQMARWFGYRMGYELYPRIWLDSAAYSRYQFLREMNDDMLDQWKVFAANNMTPLQAAPKVKNSPSYVNVKITANNKMQSARPTDFNFAGYNTQTILFDTTDEVIESNLTETDNFLNNLGEESKNGSSNRMVWKHVKTNVVLNYLKKYRSVKNDHQVNSIPNIVKWINQNNSSSTFGDWNVIYSGKGKLRQAEKGQWQVNGKVLDPVNRAKLVQENNQPNVISIGVLRGPSDLVADIDEKTLARLKDKYVEKNKTLNSYQLTKVRQEAGVANNPQLIVYIVDKNSTNRLKSAEREDLNVSNNLVGLSIMFPAVKGTNKNPVDYVAVPLPKETITEIEETNDEGEELY